MNELQILKLRPEAQLPLFAYGESAGCDLSALLLTESGRPFTKSISPSTSVMIPTGLAMKPPSGCCIMICSRSGLAAQSIFVANAPGIVDPDYIGEIKIILHNGGFMPHYIKHGDRIAQAVIVPFARVRIQLVDKLPESERGTRGFGSSGD